MAGISLLTPLLLLGLGAGVTLAAGSRATRLANLLSAGLAGLALVTALPLLALAPDRLIVSAWTVEPLPPLALSLQSDPLSVPFLLIILLITAAGFAIFDSRFNNLQAASGNQKSAAAVLFLAAAGAAFVLAGDPLTLYVTWVLMDLAVFAVVYAQTRENGSDESVRALGVNVVLGLPLLIAAVTVTPGADWGHGSGQRWPALAVVGLLVAAGGRLGVYPAPFRLPGSQSHHALRAPMLELVSVTSGAYLLLRVLQIGQGAIPLGPLWVVVAGLAVIAGAALAWWGDGPARDLTSEGARLANARTGGPDEAWPVVSWIMVVQAGVLLLAAGFDGLPGAIALLQAFTLCLAPALLYLWLALDTWPEGRWGVLWLRGLGWLALFNLVGLPPTIGFVARWALYRHLLEGRAWQLVVVLSAATALTVPPLLRLMSAGVRRSWGEQEEGRTGQVSSAPLLSRSSAQVVGVSLVGLGLLLVGLQPLLLLSSLETLMDTASPYLGQVIRGTSSIVGLEIVLALLLPILAGYGLAGAWSSYAAVTDAVEEIRTRLPAPLDSRESQTRLRQRLRVALSLGWMYEVVERGAWRLGTMILTLIAPLEGERYWGWTYLFALLVALLVLSG